MTFITWLSSLTKKVNDLFRVFYDTDNIFIHDVEFTPTNIDIAKTKTEHYQNHRFVYKYGYTYKYNYLSNSYSSEFRPILVTEHYTDTRSVPDGVDTYNGSNVTINKNSGNPYQIKNIFSWETHLFNPNQTIHITRICNIPMIVNGHFLFYKAIGVGIIGIISVGVIGCSIEN
jgi:hypothetical protein